MKVVREVTSAGPASWLLVRSRMCWGRIPSGPPAEPAGNDLNIIIIIINIIIIIIIITIIIITIIINYG